MNDAAMRLLSEIGARTSLRCVLVGFDVNQETFSTHCEQFTLKICRAVVDPGEVVGASEWTRRSAGKGLLPLMDLLYL